ncbi:MAG: alpha/beta hydrolase [Cellulomonas sp.]|uniref:alpha/beta fold hydrolase n=1 Tax=Cellulomonas sp. TaxID=40001 RepID=UPI00258DD5F2|nr:alpha/beta hydrolase [Cellulomonas sp.]MCR6704766.1 alpha/beta hydrolase [Cellulomonas sp.]
MTTSLDTPMDMDNQVVYCDRQPSCLFEESTMSTTQATIPAVAHHTARINGVQLHYVTAGATGSPLLLVHGFPETWWTFHKVIPLLARTHRVVAVDLRGFGDSSTAEDDHDSTTAAEDLHGLIEHLGWGPVHVSAQDISGGTVFRLATAYPQDVLSLTAIEMGLAGFGLEGLADVTHGGSWHIGALTAAGIPELLFAGRERELLGQWAFPSMTAVAGSVTDADVDEFARTYARPRRLARSRRPLPLDAGRGRRPQGLGGIATADRARARRRRRRRAVHLRDARSGHGG